MNPLWAVAAIPLLALVALVTGGALVGIEKQRIRRVARKLAFERSGDTGESFTQEMLRSGVPADVSGALYSEMNRALEQYEIYAFPARADDALSAVYGIRLPGERNDFMDTDLRDIAHGVARRSGRWVMAVGNELDNQLVKLMSVRDLGRWISSLPRVSS